MIEQVNQQDVDRIRDLALQIHKLGNKIKHPSDILFALAVATAGEICTKFPSEQWGQLAVDQLRLMLKMINEFPAPPKPH